MFIGHFGLALGAKQAAPGPSLGTAILAAQWADGLWPIFVLLGVEQVAIDPGATLVTPLNFISYPYSHSLLALGVWAIVFGGVYYCFRRDRRGAWVLGALVLSHWVLDALSHRPDMPLWPGGPRVGLALWNSRPGTLVVEFGLLAAGAWLYVSATRARERWGVALFWVFLATLSGIYIASFVGPPPPSVRALAVTGLLGWLFVAWGYWIDRHRVPVAAI